MESLTDENSISEREVMEANEKKQQRDTKKANLMQRIDLKTLRKKSS